MPPTADTPCAVGPFRDIGPNDMPPTADTPCDVAGSTQGRAAKGGQSRAPELRWLRSRWQHWRPSRHAKTKTTQTWWWWGDSRASILPQAMSPGSEDGCEVGHPPREGGGGGGGAPGVSTTR